MPDLLDPLGADGSAEAIVGDDAWLAALIAAETALTRSLVAVGVAPDWMLDVVDTLDQTGTVGAADIAVAARGGGNPVIPLVKRLSQRAEQVHEGATDYLHVGATSQDIVDTAAMVVAAGALDRLTADLLRLGRALAALADRHRNTAQAGRTLGQHASPTTFGFVAAGWLDAVCTLIDRARDARRHLPASLGGAVGTLAVLSQFVADRHPSANTSAAVERIVSGYAAELGLVPPPISWHTNRLPIVEATSVLAAATGVAGTIAAQVAELSRTEIGELAEGLAEGEGGSSAMPHKRNPVTSVLIVAAAKQTPGLLSTVYGSLLAEDQRAIGGWHAEWQTLGQLERLALSSVAAACALIENLHVDAGRMRANLDLTHGLLFSERVTAVLAERLGRARAFEVVRTASGRVSAEHPLAEVIDDQLAADGFASNDEARAAVRAAFDPATRIDGTAAGIDRVLARFAALGTAQGEGDPS